MPAINENLKLLRQASGMTQAEVANAITVSRQTVSSYESGRTQPDLETLRRLAELYHADLHDVLYGGNRFQRRIKQVKLAVFILISILLIGILVHSALLLTANTFFPVTSGTTVSADNRPLIDMRLTLRQIAETAVGICTIIFSVGCIAMLFPTITVVHAIPFHKLVLFCAATVAVMFACAASFDIADKVFGLGDYLFPLWNSLIVISLCFVVISTSKIIKRRRSQ